MEAAVNTMSYRERIVWVQLISIVVVFTAYYVALVQGWLGGGLSLFIAAAAAQTLLGTILSMVLMRGASAEPADERDLAIDRRSSRVAYLVLIWCLMLYVLAIFITGGSTEVQSLWGPLGIANAVLFCVFVAEVVRYTMQVVAYRRGE